MENCTCSSCQAEINIDNDFYTHNRKDEILCESCEQSAWEYSNTVVIVKDGEIKTYRWCDDFGFVDAEYWEPTKLESVTGFEYVRTDGWRGYWNAQIGEGYKVVANGWSTGKWDDVAYKHGFNDFVDQIGQGELYCPFELIFAYGLTSNVFSVAGDVIIKESDFEAFSEWIAQEAGLTIEELQRALS